MCAVATNAFPHHVLAPIVATARRLDWPARRAFLEDLRRDAPTMIAAVERILAAGDGSVSSLQIVPTVGLLARIRQFVELKSIAESTSHHGENGAD